MCHDYVATDRDKMTINLQDEPKNSYVVICGEKIHIIPTARLNV